MLPYSLGFDVAGPGLFVALGAGLAGALVGAVLIVLVEALVLRFMGWGPFGRAVVTSFLMNLASFVVGFAYLPLLGRINGLIWVVGAFILSVVVEAGVLAVQRKVPYGRAVAPVLVSNAVTYAPIAVLIGLGATVLGV